jgi:hypothetical protein
MFCKWNYTVQVFLDALISLAFNLLVPHSILVVASNVKNTSRTKPVSVIVTGMDSTSETSCMGDVLQPMDIVQHAIRYNAVCHDFLTVQILRTWHTRTPNDLTYC